MGTSGVLRERPLRERPGAGVLQAPAGRWASEAGILPGRPAKLRAVAVLAGAAGSRGRQRARPAAFPSAPTWAPAARGPGSRVRGPGRGEGASRQWVPPAPAAPARPPPRPASPASAPPPCAPPGPLRPRWTVPAGRDLPSLPTRRRASGPGKRGRRLGAGREGPTRRLTFVQQPLEVVEDPAEVGQAAHELLVVHQLHQVIWGGLRLLLRFHFPDHIPGSAAHSARRRRRRRRGGRGGEPRPPAARDSASRSAPLPRRAPGRPDRALAALSPPPQALSARGPTRSRPAAAPRPPARRVPHEAGGREAGLRGPSAGAGRSAPDKEEPGRRRSFGWSRPLSRRRRFCRGLGVSLGWSPPRPPLPLPPRSDSAPPLPPPPRLLLLLLLTHLAAEFASVQAALPAAAAAARGEGRRRGEGRGRAAGGAAQGGR